VIGDRALGEKAEDVARLGSAIITTLQGEGLAACGKHFPGHGDTSTDSHFELPLVEHPLDRLRRVEFVPFRAAVAAGVATMMTAHVFVPALDETRPASLSKRIVGDLLRDELSYEGVILSDDLEMKAIANEYAVPAAAVLALEAGCDGVLICSGDHDTQAAAIEALVHAVEEDRLPLTRVDDALARQRRAKERFLALPIAARPLSGRALRSALGRDENRAVAEEMSRYL
jgi:beta-N-acetylhexosaminidase